MSTVAVVLERKGSGVVTVKKSVPAVEAAREMNRHSIGSVVVVGDDEPREVVGILTERDFLTRLVAAGREPAALTVADLMTRPVICCSRHTRLADLRNLMRQRRIRHVPVVDDAGLCGLVSIGDLNAYEADGMSMTITALEEYICRG